MSEEIIALKKEHLSFFGVLKSVLLDPVQAFESLRDNKTKSWWVWALICILLSALVGFAVGQIAVEAMQAMLEGQNFPEGQGPPPGSIGMFTLITSIVTGAIGPIFIWLIWGALMNVLASILGGQSNTLGKTIIMTIWAHLPFAIRSLFQGIYVLVTGEAEMPSIGIGALMKNPMPAMDEMMSPDFDFTAFSDVTAFDRAIYGLANTVDLFAIWRILLLVLGLAAVTRISRGKSAGIVIGIWIIGLAIAVAFTTVSGGMFGGPPV